MAKEETAIMSETEGCRICRVVTDVLLASYELKDTRIQNAVLRFLVKHAAEAGHKPSEGWVLVGGRKDCWEN